jgi:hypothetical protein
LNYKLKGVNGHEIYKTSNDIVSIGGSVHPGLQSLRLQLFIIWEEYEMTKEKAIKEKKKITLDNLTWKGWITVFTVAIALGAAVGHFL